MQYLVYWAMERKIESRGGCGATVGSENHERLLYYSSTEGISAENSASVKLLHTQFKYYFLKSFEDQITVMSRTSECKGE